MANNKNVDLYKVAGTVATAGLLVVAGAFGGAYLAQPNEPTVVASVSVTPVESEVSEPLVVVEPVNTDLADIKAQVFKEDFWEAESQVLSEEEFEDNDYKDLKKFIVNEYEDDFNDFDNYKDIDDFTVSIRDVDFDNMDEDDKDGDVTHDLRIRYEDKDGNDVKRFVTVETEFEDGDLETQEFEETE